MSKRGRPNFSPIRNNLVDLLYFVGKSHGYALYKKYIEVFHSTTIRSIYYHLNKGVKLGVFKIEKVEEVKGNYSWGGSVRRIVFVLGPNAKPSGDLRILKRLKSIK